MIQIFHGWLLSSLTLLASGAEVDFAHEVVPILKAHCVECHAGDKQKGGLSMNSRVDLLRGSENGVVIVPGKADESLLLKVILSTDPDEQMPPKGDRLTAIEVTKLRSWIDTGLPWTDGLTLKKAPYDPPLKPRKPTLPAATTGREHPVDRILDADLAQHHLPTPAPLDDGAFCRRVHLDLVGLLPTPERLAGFLQEASQDKRQHLIGELLGNVPAYAEHWLTFWNDLLRNDYAGTGYIDGGRKQISAWLYQALSENKPYDQFVRELVAPNAESEGFGRGIKWRGEVSAGQTVPVQFAQSLGQAFLGINLKCASCHDSFIDRWKLDDAYGLAAIYSDTPLEIHRCDKPTGRQAKPAWLFPELGEIDASKPQAERLQQLAALMTHPENGRFTRTIVNRLWHRLMGHGIVHPVDAMQTEPWSTDLLDFLATDLAEHRYDLKYTLALICSSQAYQSVAEIVPQEAAKDYHYAGPRAKRLTAEQFTDAVWQITSTAPKKFDAPVQRVGTTSPKLAAITAQWIWTTDQKAKPAEAGETARCRHEFDLPVLPKSAGLAITCDNSFKLLVNHREVASSDNWETPVGVDLLPALKTGHNEIVVIAKNGGSGPNLAGLLLEVQLRFADGSQRTLASDPTWLWNTAPALPDGTYAPETGTWKPGAALDGNVWAKTRDSFSAALVEALNGGGPMVRAALLKSDFLMRALGRPNREQIVSTRPNDLTTLEAMDLHNGEILTQRLEEGAQDILQRHPGISSAALVQWLYAFAYARDATPAEAALAEAALGAQPTVGGLQDLLWALLVQPEFQTIR